MNLTRTKDEVVDLMSSVKHRIYSLEDCARDGYDGLTLQREIDRLSALMDKLREMLLREWLEGSQG